MKVPATPVRLEDSQYDQADYAGEIMAAPMNFTVATTVILENEHVRVWDFQLPIGYRHPFHCHVTRYFWVCTEQRYRRPTFARWTVDGAQVQCG